MTKDIAEIIERLEKQKASVEKAIEILQGIDEDGGEKPVVAKRGKKKMGTKPAPKRILSPEAKERIAAAQRKRWAKQRRAAKKAA